MLIFTDIIAVLFGVVYLILHWSFFKLATANKGAAKVQYVEKQARAASAGNALLRKEFCRFLQSPNYMLNCGLGIVFMLDRSSCAAHQAGCGKKYDIESSRL